jgi:hypothetical protein
MFFYGGCILIAMGILIYLIAVRIEEKKNESFEKRDN